MKKNEIFIASRFNEFLDLRNFLKDKITEYSYLEAIDLNNNEASHRSPLNESLFYVKKSQIMLLLVGETYGTIPEGEEYSYTHLEYKEAVKENSNTRVLVFCIGSSYSGTEIKYSEDKNLKNWQIELENNHRLKKFSGNEDTQFIAEKILIDLQSSLYDLNITNLEIDSGSEKELDLEISAIDDDFLEDSEVAFLDNKMNDIEEIDLIKNEDDVIDGFDLLKIPNKLASIEQKKEAQYAIDLKDYSTAIKHLKKSLQLRPLDFETNYWLAKLYITSAKKSLFYDIEEYLLRAAKIAENQNSNFKASHCYQLIVQASIFSDKKEEGLKYLELAEELTPNFSRLYYEKAKFMLYNNNLDDAEEALIKTINIKMDFVELIENDPFFKNYEEFIKKIFINIKDSFHKITNAILHETNKIRNIFDYREIEISLIDYGLMDLWKKSRYGINNQYRVLTSNLNKTDANEIQYIENKIKMERNKFEENKKNLEAQYSKENNKIEDDNNEKILSLENEHNQKKSYYNITAFAILIIAILASLILHNEKKDEILLYVDIAALFILGAIFVSRRKSINLHKNLMDNITDKHHNMKEQLQLDFEVSIKKLGEESHQKVTSYQMEINEIKEYYEKIKNAFLIFEKKSITLTQFSFIPFKSLKNAHRNNIIRVTKWAYEKAIETGSTIEIKEDLPAYLDIPAIDLEESSFLAKVIFRSQNKIVLSRRGAYMETEK